MVSNFRASDRAKYFFELRVPIFKDRARVSKNTFEALRIEVEYLVESSTTRNT